MPTWMVKKRVGDLVLVGYSVAGVESVVAAPELSVCFDVGRAPTEIISIDTVCLTHGHMDHAAGVAYYFSQRGFIGNSPGRIIVHRSLAQSLQALMGVWADIEGHHSASEIVGVEPGQDVAIRRDLFVRPFAVNHVPAALGYAVIEARHKLKSEYSNLSGPQLVELKKKGVSIERRLEVSLVAYCGDTAVGRFLDEDCVRDAGVLVIECTFFDPEHITRARAGRHVHVCDLPGILQQVSAPHVVLIHLSQRTDLRAARRILANALDEADLARITFLMERPPRRRSERDQR
ncbi:MAG: MBL fold metallo-hydrolase [Planctomycetota bacterium]|jgi:ribonuclease Z